MTEEAGLAAAPAEPKRNRGAKYWLIGCSVGLLVLILIGCCAAGVLTFLSVSQYMTMGSRANTAFAKSMLRNAAAAADQYAAENDGVYTGMTAAVLEEIDNKIDWVDSNPKPGQVGIVEVKETSYTFLYISNDEREYRLNRLEDGTLEYNLPEERPLP